MTKKTDPSLDDLSIFIAVCETSGFRSAAKRLGLSPSNISDTITRIEALLGVPLFTRNTRSVQPTEAGRELASRLSPLFMQARTALHEAASSGGQVRGLLKMNVTGAVMVDILPPLIDQFLTRHPEVRVELVVEDRLVDAIAEGCVAGIRYGEHLAQDMIAVPIGPAHQQLAVAASPGYLRARGRPTSPTDVLLHDCIRLRFSSGTLTAWDFERAGEKLSMDPQSRLIIGVDAAMSAIDLACAGHGLICTFRNWLEPYFDKGTLEPVLDGWWLQFEGPQLYFPSRSMPAPLRAFVDLVAGDRARDNGGNNSETSS